MAADDFTDERHVWIVRAADGGEIGPVSIPQIAQARSHGRILDDAGVRHVDAKVWEPLGVFMARMSPPSKSQVDATGELTVPRPAAFAPAPRGADDTAPRPALRRSVLGDLFDFTFTTFFTSRIVGGLYVCVLLFAAAFLLASLFFAFGAVAGGVAAARAGADDGISGMGIVTGFVIAAGGFVRAASIVVLGRVVLEFIVVTFRISETLTEIRTNTRPGPAARP